jgi:hypothetical protein
MDLKESPIFVKTYDFLIWLSNHISRFPKSERFRLAKRIEDTCFDFYKKIIHAARNQDECRSCLEAIDERLYLLKVYMRLAKDRGFSSPSQYQFASEKLIEIGKLLGGWLKTQQ